jgi:ferredoxin
VVACPVDTIKITNSQLSFTPSECVGCGVCGAVCPTGAYTLDDFQAINYIFKFLEQERSVLSCRDGVLPCIASLSVEELLSLVLLSEGEIVLDVAGCSECAIAHKNLALIDTIAQEVSFLLEALLVQKRLRVESVGCDVTQELSGLSRRELLSKEGLKHAITLQQQFEAKVKSCDDEEKIHLVGAEAIAKIKAKNIPQRRSLLMMALGHIQPPEVFHVIEGSEISFTTQKDLDEVACTNCQMCYRICPTGALSSDAKGGVINFNPLACVACQSCHDVCEPQALQQRHSFDLGNFFEPKVETLVRFEMKRCDECGNIFAYRGGEMMCHRCLIEEQEAKRLWGIE